MKIVTVKPRLFEELLLPSGVQALRIEIAADEEIDCGVMDDASYNLFVKADSDEGIKKAKWFEEVKSKKFVFRPSEETFYWLILSNAYSDKKVAVAYAITEE